MSGEAGAQAVYRLVRRVYVPLLEKEQWPADGWIGELQQLALRSHTALAAYCAAESQSDIGKDARLE
jgi:hypothetical protein